MRLCYLGILTILYRTLPHFAHVMRTKQGKHPGSQSTSSAHCSHQTRQGHGTTAVLYVLGTCMEDAHVPRIYAMVARTTIVYVPAAVP